MPAMVLLVKPPQLDQGVAPAAVSRLAALGVTSLTLLRNTEIAAIVLEGWAFDPRRTAAAAAEIVAGGEGSEPLLPVVEMAISRESKGGMGNV